EPAELDDDIWRLRNLENTGIPLCEALGLLVLVRPDAEWPADVVEDDRGLRIGLGEVGQVGELGMVQPGLKGEAERCQPYKAGPPGRIKHLALDRISARLRECIACVP